MNVTTLVFLGLAVLWAVVLLPEVIRKVSGTRRSSDSIRNFNRQLSVLDRSGSGNRRPASNANVIDLRDRRQARGIGVPPARRQVQGVSPAARRRRQEILTVLGVSALLTLLCTIAFGGPFLMLHLLCAALLIGYVALLATVAQQPSSAPSLGRSGAQAPLGGLRAQPLDRRVAN